MTESTLLWVMNAQRWSDKIRTGSDSDQPKAQLRKELQPTPIFEVNSGWSLPPPHTGCPRGDPGSLPVLILRGPG